MAVGIVPGCTPDDDGIGLGLRRVVERDRKLRSDVESGAERTRERLLQRDHRGAVATALRLPHDEVPVEQFQAFVFTEHPIGDELVVLAARPATSSQGRIFDRHVPMVTRRAPGRHGRAGGALRRMLPGEEGSMARAAQLAGAGWAGAVAAYSQRGPADAARIAPPTREASPPCVAATAVEHDAV